MLLQWGENTNEIAKQIKSRQGFLKIILKTFNDGFFLERWIEHHANIVGLENLVIADNMSTDEDVLAIYEKYGKGLFVFQFSGSHNHIHARGGIFKALYEAIKLSSQYYLFIDTDEFLVWLDEDQWRTDDTIVKFLHSINLRKAIPCTWLYNAANSDKIFHVSSTGLLFNRMKYGKPLLVSAKINANETFIHNEQFPKLNFWHTSCSNFFLLHMTKLSSEQRIKINKSKLVSRKLCDVNDSIDKILTKDWSNCKDPIAIRYINDIQDCIKNQYDKREYQDIPSGYLELSSNGTINFASGKERAVLEQFIKEAKLNIHLSLDVPIEDAIDVVTKGIAYRNVGDFVAAKAAFTFGMKNFPNHLDQYGHPAFRKELMRMLLSQQKWTEASALIPKQGELGGEHWHEILFARAYLAINDIMNAKVWWDRVVEINPSNGEAKTFFDKLKTV